MRHHQSSSRHTDTHFALTADDCPWFRCYSEADNLAQQHAPFHIHNVVFNGSKFKRRSSVQRRGDGLTAAPLKQADSWKYTARLRWHSYKHVANQPGCCALRTASCVGPQKTRRKWANRSVRKGFVWLLLLPLFPLGCIWVREADGQGYLLFSNRWLKRTNKDMTAKTVLWAAKASHKKALSPSSCGRLTGLS